jgi:hypothetical protein
MVFTEVSLRLSSVLNIAGTRQGGKSRRLAAFLAGVKPPRNGMI